MEQKKTQVIAMTNLKGGVGKTTTSANLGAGLARLGYKVLLVDWDPQGNLTQHFGLDNKEEGFKALFDALDKNAGKQGYFHVDKLYPYEIPAYGHALSVLANNYRLSEFEVEFSGNKIGSEKILSNILKLFRGAVDFIIIDCQPSLSVLTINAYLASDYLIIPMDVGKFSEEGLGKILESRELLNSHYEIGLQVLGVLFVRHNPKTILAKEYKEAFSKLEEVFPLLETHIRENEAIKQSQMMGMDIFAYDQFKNEESKRLTVSNASEDYYNLTNEILYRLGMSEAPEKAREEENGEAEKEQPELLVPKKKGKGNLRSEFEEFLKLKEQ